MNDEQINKAIAEHCKRTHDYNQFPCYGVPDYCNDLNAMHEAEKWLSYEQRYQYATTTVDFDGVFAPARQRAEAFLRAVGKWEDGQ